MPIANLNQVISDFPLLSFHAVNGEDVSADLSGLVDRLTKTAISSTPTEFQSTMMMIRGRLRAQLEALDCWHTDMANLPCDSLRTAERDFYQRAIAEFDDALSREARSLEPA